jgi:hypothetical protein
MRSSLPPADPTGDLTATLGDPPAPVTPGDDVDLWCRSLGTWSSGFEAVDVDAEGWRVRRRSDGALLPVRFSDGDVRAVPGTHHPHHLS